MRLFGVALCGIVLSAGFLVGDIRAQIRATFPKAATPPVIDGVSDDAVWQTAVEHTIAEFEVYGEPLDGPEDLKVSFRGLWDDDNLYVLVEVQDDELEANPFGSWEDDSIEIYIDAQNIDTQDYQPSQAPGRPVYQFTVMAGAEPLPSSTTLFTWGMNSYQCQNGVCQYPQGSDTGGAVLDEEAGIFTFEVAFPWVALEETPADILARGSFGFGIGINDNDDGGDRDSHAVWFPNDVYNFVNDFWHRSQPFPSVALEADGSVLGDFNGNGVLDAPDIDMLTAASAAGLNPDKFDLNADSVVDVDDVRIWVNDLRNTWIGDANVDGEFDSTDVIQVLAAGKFDKDVDAVWTNGDLDGDGRFATSDLIFAFAGGGFGKGPRPITAAVPEPSALVLLVIGGLFLLRRR